MRIQCDINKALYMRRTCCTCDCFLVLFSTWPWTGNTIGQQTYLEGPIVTGIKYNSTISSLIVTWDRVYTRQDTATFQISIRNCSGENHTEPAIIDLSCNETEIVGLTSNDTILIEVQACNAQGECGFNLPFVSPPNLIAINSTNEGMIHVVISQTQPHSRITTNHY